MQHLRAVIVLTDPRLPRCETELVPNRGGGKPVSRTRESTSQITLRNCSGSGGQLFIEPDYRAVYLTGTTPSYARTGIKWPSGTVARTVAARKVTPHDPRNELKMNEIPLLRSGSLRPVTSEVAGSSPVVPAIPFNHFGAFLFAVRIGYVSSCVSDLFGATADKDRL